MNSKTIIGISLILLISTIGTIIWLADLNKTKRISYTLLLLSCGPLLYTLYNPYLVIIAFPVVLIIHLLFISYWSLIYVKKKKLAKLLTVLLGCVLVLITYSPWLLEWTFKKEDSLKLLEKQKIYLNTNYKLLDNSYHGYLTFSKSFVLSLSDSDYNMLKNIITSKKDSRKTTLNDIRYYEDDAFYGIEIECITPKKLTPSYYHIQLSKLDDKTNYWAEKGEKNILHYFSTNQTNYKIKK